ncbi:MAG TPA: hypothetical protein VL595_27695 [Pseudonocardia sp.]|jgi:hypothetical protein|nr:hypothetical protein [Pseudonocardia sp.]
MKKALVSAAVVGILAVLATRLGSKMQDIDWEKRFAALPDNAPPKWMFRNIAAIRENTDRILTLVETERSGSDQSAEPASMVAAGEVRASGRPEQ